MFRVDGTSNGPVTDLEPLLDAPQLRLPVGQGRLEGPTEGAGLQAAGRRDLTRRGGGAGIRWVDPNHWEGRQGEASWGPPISFDYPHRYVAWYVMFEWAEARRADPVKKVLRPEEFSRR